MTDLATAVQVQKLGELMARYIDKPRPWSASVARHRDFALCLSIFHPDEMEPPTRWHIAPSGEAEDVTNLD